MSTYTLSRITDVNGDNWNIKAKALESQITIGGSSGGDVTGTTTSDLSGDTTFTLSIGSGKVTTDKIADSAVTNSKIADGSVNWDKIATSVKNGTIAGNYTEKLATCAQVKTYVDEAITGHGSYLGQKSVAEINALTDMKNGDHVSVSDSGSITNPDGTSTSVNAGDNVIYDGTLRKWDCLAGNYKLKQTAKEIENTDSTKTISKVTQNENGEVSVTYQTIGKVSSATTADNYNPTSGTIKTALDSKLDDSQLITSWSSTASDSKIASEKLVKDSLDEKAVDSDVVHKTGYEVIEDAKAFKNGFILTKPTVRTTAKQVYKSGVVAINSSNDSAQEGKYFVAKVYLCNGNNYNLDDSGSIVLTYTGNYGSVNDRGLVKVAYNAAQRKVLVAWKETPKKFIPSTKLLQEVVDNVKYGYILLVMKNAGTGQACTIRAEYYEPDSTSDENIKRFPYVESNSWMTLDEIKAVDPDFTLDALTTDWQDADNDLSVNFNNKLKSKNSINLTGVTTQYVKIECGGNLREFLINAQGSMGALHGTILYRAYGAGTSNRTSCTKLQGASGWSCYSETVSGNQNNLYIDLGHVRYESINVTSIAYQGEINVTCVDSIPSGLTALSWTPVPQAAVSNTLASARDLKVNLSSANAQSFDGSSNATSIGVSGQLADANIASASTWNAKQYPIQSNSIQNIPASVQGYFFIDCTNRHQTYIIKLEHNVLNNATFLYRSYWSGAGVFTKLTCLQSQTRDIVAYNEMYTPEGGIENSYHRVYFKLPIVASSSIWYITATKVGNSSYDYMPTPEYTTELPESATLIPCEYLQTEDNKVTSWSATTTDTKYPSEKLVKDSLDGKQDTLSWDVTPTANSTKPVTSGGIKTYVDSKTYLNTKTLTSSDDLNSVYGSASTPVMWHKWASSSVPANAPVASGSALMEVRYIAYYLGNYCTQTVYTIDGEIYVRKCRSNVWDESWTRHYLDATSTYSDTGTQAINGTGVKAAINTEVGLIGTSVFGASNEGGVCSIDFTSAELGKLIEVYVRGTASPYKTSVYFISVYKAADAGGVSGAVNISASCESSTHPIVKYKKEFDTGSTTNGKIYLSVYGYGYYSNFTVFCRTGSASGVSILQGVTDLTGYTAVDVGRGTYVVGDVAAGSSAVPVYANSDGAIIACTTADLKAGKDASGNTITSTYATKTELDSKWYSQCKNLTASDDLNNVKGNSSHTTSWYWWGGSSQPSNRPDGMDNDAMMCVYRPFNAEYVTQEIWSSVNGHYIRKCNNGAWDDWVGVYDSPRKSDDVASFTTDDSRAYTGKAIAEYVAGAIGGNVGGYMGECSKMDVAYHTFKMGDWFVASEAGTYTYIVSGTSKTIDNVVIGDELYFTTDNELQVKPTTTYEKSANKVTTLDNSTTHYPSTSAVKTYVDTGIANLSSIYATKTELDSKAYVNATTLTSANNLNSVCGSASTPVMWYKWSPSSVPTNAPTAGYTSLMEVRFFVNSSGDYCMQTVYNAVGEIYVRKCRAGAWDASWTRHYLDATSTYSSTGTQAVNGTAVASAINALDSTKTSTNGTNVQVRVAETYGKISSVSITTDNTENRNNKITAWNATASTTAYPAESLVVSALANKKNVQTAKTDPTASGTGISYIATITQDANGEITATKSTVRTGTTSQTGVVQLSDTSSSTDSSKAATPKGVWNAINTLDKSDSAVSNQFVTAVSETNGIISVSRAQPTISNVSGLQTALNSKEGSFTITYNSEEHALVFSKAFT